MRTLLFLFALLMVAPAFAGESHLAVPARDIARGEIIADSDLSIVAVPAEKIQAGAATELDNLAGREARRFLRAGDPVRLSDVRMPVLVSKGATVTMMFRAPGISLTGVGKAMGDAGMGESVTVLNPVSYRQVTCVVTGAGQVEAGALVPLASTNLSQRLAYAPTNTEGSHK